MTIEAAGGVVLRTVDAGTQVLVVHRPTYDDWSLPKGKLDPGEDAAAGAVREVAEETGVHAACGRELQEVRYLTPDGRDKRVRWFLMAPTHGDPADRPADREVDEARWVPLADTDDLLTYPTEREVLADALTREQP